MANIDSGTGALQFPPRQVSSLVRFPHKVTHRSEKGRVGRTRVRRVRNHCQWQHQHHRTAPERDARGSALLLSPLFGEQIQNLERVQGGAFA